MFGLLPSHLLFAVCDSFSYASSAKVLTIPLSELPLRAAVLLPVAAVLLPDAAVLPPVTAVLATWALPFGRWLISLTV